VKTYEQYIQTDVIPELVRLNLLDDQTGKASHLKDLMKKNTQRTR